ncbi:hypothetical protein AgCh_037787 [Apium graveolens]
MAKKSTEPILTKVEEDLPVFELAYDFYFKGVESDEEVLGDDERGEIDKGYKYVLNKDKLTYTRVKEDYPAPTLAKLALERYNSIEDTNYEYVGLVKAYVAPVGAFNYTVHFQARLPDQSPIYFQAIIF